MHIYCQRIYIVCSMQCGTPLWVILSQYHFNAEKIQEMPPEGSITHSAGLDSRHPKRSNITVCIYKRICRLMILAILAI